MSIQREFGSIIFILLVIELWVMKIFDYKNYFWSHEIIFNFINLDGTLSFVIFNDEPEHVAWVIPIKHHLPIQQLIVVQGGYRIEVSDLSLINFF